MKNATKKAVLLLEDGTLFHGSSTGLDGTAYGEICFNTGMTGYQEIFTDPSYFGQLMVMATSHIGNYGVHAEEVESNNIQMAGLVVVSGSSTAPDTGSASLVSKVRLGVVINGGRYEYCVVTGVT